MEDAAERIHLPTAARSAGSREDRAPGERDGGILDEAGVGESLQRLQGQDFEPGLSQDPGVGGVLFCSERGVDPDPVQVSQLAIGERRPGGSDDGDGAVLGVQGRCAVQGLCLRSRDSTRTAADKDLKVPVISRRVVLRPQGLLWRHPAEVLREQLVKQDVVDGLG